MPNLVAIGSHLRKMVSEKLQIWAHR